MSQDSSFGLWTISVHLFIGEGGFRDTILFWMVGIAFARLVRYVLAKPLGRARRGLCAGCAFVHMQYGATGRNAVFCTFGGGVREVKLDVLYCTDYRSRNAPPRLVQVGFAPEFGGAESKA